MGCCIFNCLENGELSCSTWLHAELEEARRRLAAARAAHEKQGTAHTKAELEEVEAELKELEDMCA